MPAFYEGLPLDPLAIRCALEIDGQDSVVPKPSASFVRGADPRLRIAVRRMLPASCQTRKNEV